MKAYLWEKIMKARQEPEHIRRRYVFICLAVSMLFIVGIWFLSLNEAFHTASKDIPETVLRGKQTFSSQEKEPSLNDLLDQSTSLRIQNELESGKSFFDKQLEERQKKEEANNNEGIAE